MFIKDVGGFFFNKHQYCESKFETYSVYNTTEVSTVPILLKKERIRTSHV